MNQAPSTIRKPGLPRPLLAEAAERMLAVRAAPEDAALDARTRAWIEADDRHRQAWALAERGWIASGESLLAPPAPANRNRVLRRMFAAACVAAAFAAPRIFDDLRADAITGSGEIARSTLADGSEVTLAGGSALGARIGPDARQVALLRGAAYFDVRRDPDRPFVVAAEDVTITVRGTAFDVMIGADTIAVGVAHGTVAVTAGGSEAVLHAGERLDYRKSDRALRVAPVAPEDVALWRQDRLAVSDAPLGEVLDALVRRNGGYIVAPAELRARRVTGVFDLDDAARALNALLAPQGASAHEIGGGIWWLRDRAVSAS